MAVELNLKLLLSAVFLLSLSSVAVPLSSDGLSLLSLKSAVDPSPAASLAFADWNPSDSDPCKWTGVSCSSNSGDPRVVGLSLAGRQLSGYVPSELGNLGYLRRLNLHGNSFQGSLPSQLFNATSLHSLYLYDNNFSGSLPASLCNLPRIQTLDLSRNSFSGPISKTLLANCRQLQRLVLAGNALSGPIPSGVWSHLSDLIRLDLSSNRLTGPIPADLGQLQSLSETLNLSFNHLTGRIPVSLGNLPMTVSFDLRSNNLSGEIPQTGSFASQGPTAFLNNPSLCGFPLQTKCHGDSPGTAASTPDSSHGGRTSSHRGLDSGTIVLISTADAAAVAFVGLIIIYIYWKKKDDSSSCSCTGRTKLGGHAHDKADHLCACFGRPTSNESDADPDKGSGMGAAGSGGPAVDGELVAIDKSFSFELDELLRASAYVLGKSGLGIVYKVVLGNGVPVAVRRLGEGGEQRYKEFAAEIEAIGKVKHPNVVRLRAYYWAPDEKLLISDFISNGNLATALQGKAGQLTSSVSWSTRLRIAKGTAKGLAYLHECSPRKFVHGDIKPSNILLDNEFQPHISDFGLSRLIHITESDPSSSGGFMGSALPYIKPAQQSLEKSTAYKAPEARIPGTRPTQKWDVYSFGVILLQLLTGKSPEASPAATSTSSEIQDLVRWVRKGFEEEIPLSEMVDPALLQEVHAKKEVLAVFHLALGCTEGDPEIRPRMKTVSENLDRIGS